MAMLTVADIPADATFVSDSQDVEAVKRHLGGDLSDYYAFFVTTKDGEYTAVWGIGGIVPYLERPAFRIV